MATDSKLHKEYRETQKGMNTGLTYSGWLEDRVNELREQVKLFSLPDVSKPFLPQSCKLCGQKLDRCICNTPMI